MNAAVEGGALLQGTAVAGHQRLHLRLPATSANLGPGFDTLALALTIGLEIEAVRAGAFHIVARGRNPEICGELRRNLLFDVYQKTLLAQGVPLVPLALQLDNGIPVGMGCGSSAAVRLGGVALANYFGGLGWGRDKVLAEACRLEGHPDNAAACWMGGLTVATMDAAGVHALTIQPAAAWRVLLVLPDTPLATTTARTVLPESYSRPDAVFNLQRSSLLTAAFASGRGDLLQFAMQDRFHQPFRGELCPLLGRLLPLAGTSGILGVALSGAGPSILLVLDEDSPMDHIRSVVTERVSGTGAVELIECGMETIPAQSESTVS